jgi:diacylglycerol kinase (ATP)
MSYTTIAIIYNPKSTGQSKELAQDFAAKIRKQLPDQQVDLFATEHAGHAEELAYSLASSHDKPLIISSSGDGGYNEVINGAMKAQNEGATPTTGLLPAGNANDHYRNLHERDLIDQIIHQQSTTIDLLKMSCQSGGKPVERYAHSYIGFGLTPSVGKELNKVELNRFTESWVVIRSLLTAKAVRLKVGTAVHSYESIIISNVDEMSKYLKISQPSSVTDGKFEVTIFPRRSKLQLIKTLLKASIQGAEENMQVATFSFETTRRTLVQVDGEVMTLDANSGVTITAEPRVLRCVV